MADNIVPQPPAPDDNGLSFTDGEAQLNDPVAAPANIQSGGYAASNGTANGSMLYLNPERVELTAGNQYKGGLATNDNWLHLTSNIGVLDANNNTVGATQLSITDGLFSFTSNGSGFNWTGGLLTSSKELPLNLTGNLTYLTKGYVDTKFAGVVVAPTNATANQVLTYNGTGWAAANSSGSNFQPINPMTTYGANQPLAENPMWAGELLGDLVTHGDNKYGIGVGTYEGEPFTVGVYHGVKWLPGDSITGSVEARDSSGLARIEKSRWAGGVLKEVSAATFDTDTIDITSRNETGVASSFGSLHIYNTDFPEPMFAQPAYSGTYNGTKHTLSGSGSVASLLTLQSSAQASIDLSSNSTSSFAQLNVMGNLIKTDRTIATLSDVAKSLTANGLISGNNTVGNLGITTNGTFNGDLSAGVTQYNGTTSNITRINKLNADAGCLTLTSSRQDAVTGNIVGSSSVLVREYDYLTSSGSGGSNPIRLYANSSDGIGNSTLHELKFVSTKTTPYQLNTVSRYVNGTMNGSSTLRYGMNATGGTQFQLTGTVFDWTDNSILTRSYGDTRYAPLTKTSPVAITVAPSTGNSTTVTLGTGDIQSVLTYQGVPVSKNTIGSISYKQSFTMTSNPNPADGSGEASMELLAAGHFAVTDVWGHGFEYDPASRLLRHLATGADPVPDADSYILKKYADATYAPIGGGGGGGAFVPLNNANDTTIQSDQGIELDAAGASLWVDGSGLLFTDTIGTGFQTTIEGGIRAINRKGNYSLDSTDYITLSDADNLYATKRTGRPGVTDNVTFADGTALIIEDGLIVEVMRPLGG